MIGLQEIEKARTAVAEFVRRTSSSIRRTPLISSEILSGMTNKQLVFKAECLQTTGSFKVPGVINAVVSEMDDGCEGILGVSSGNQGLAIAYVAKLMGKRALILLPPGASKAKAALIRSYGAEILELHFTSFDQAMEDCTALAKERGYYFPNLFANSHFMAGHGTVGLQVLEDIPDADAIIIPGGSGVLAAGFATACKSVNPAVKIFVAGAQNSPCLLTAFQQRTPLVLPHVPDTICDGLRSPVVSELVIEHVLKYVDDIVAVSEEEVIKAMRLIWSHTKVLSESSGAVTLAALLSNRLPIENGAKVVCLLTGGNTDLTQALKYLAE